VEDSKADVFLMREAIQKSEIDADIDIVRDGHEATRYFDSADADQNACVPDLILLDMNLPKRSGDEVLKHLRAGQRCKSVRVLIVSSSDGPHERRAVETFGVAGFFRKPSSYAEFMKLGLIVDLLLKTDS
jgi:CheY-like chemotaxis protein